MSQPDAPRIVADETVAPAGWDERAVSVTGGHVMQSAPWAGYRRDQGYEPRFLTFDDGRVALVLLRRSPGLPGVEATIRRGPARGDDSAARAAERASTLASWARGQGARDLFLDPERPADPTYEAAMEAAGFGTAPELEPSIHVMRLDFGPGDRRGDAVRGSEQVHAPARAGRA